MTPNKMARTPINQLIGNLHWDIVDGILKITKTEPQTLLDWLVGLKQIPFPCISYPYLYDQAVWDETFLFFSDYRINKVTRGSDMIPRESARYIYVPVGFIGSEISIEEFWWNLWLKRPLFRTKLIKKYKEKYEL